jgi:hypothetical protein
MYGDSGADRKLCEDVYACFRDTGCLGVMGDPIKCWCGTNYTDKTQTCFTDNAPPTQANGPCLRQVLAAAKSTDAATVRLHFADPAFPIGGAVNLIVCRTGFCDQIQGPPDPSWRPACGLLSGN